MKFLTNYNIIIRFTTLILQFIIISLTCFFPDKLIAKSGQEHISEYKQWFGGGIVNDVSKDLNSSILDTVPWFKGEKAGGGLHRLHWGHSVEWYFGEMPSEETINTIKHWKGGNISNKEAIKLYKQYLPKGGGKELLVKHIRKSYPRLSIQHAEILADTVFVSHMEGDRATKSWPKMDKQVRERIEKKLSELKKPAVETIETVIDLDAMKVKGSNISEKAERFVRTAKNQERLATTIIAKAEKSIEISNPKDRHFIGIQKQEIKYMICRGDKERVNKILTRHHQDYNVLVNDDLFEKLKKDPKFSEHVKTGKIVVESDVLSKKTIQECSKDNLRKKSEQIIAKGEGLYAANKLKAFYEHIPQDVRISIKAGTIAALFSGLGNTWNVFQGDKEIDDAAMETLGTGVHAGTSLYVTNALIQRIGSGKYALTAIVDASGKELMPGIPPSVATTSAFLNYGVATFIFDQTKSVFFFAKGDIDANKFMIETGKNILTSSGSGVASMCAVALGCNPAGFTVMAVSIGGYLAVNQTISYAEKLNKRNYLFIDDVLGHLPLEMQNRITPWDRGDVVTPWDRADTITPWDRPDRQTSWDRPNNATPWD